MTLFFLPHWRAEMPSSPMAPLHDSLKKCEDDSFLKVSENNEEGGAFGLFVAIFA